MALNVISNFAANVAHRNLTRSDMELTDSMAKLSSGTRVVSAKDDAASLAIGSRLAAEVKALTQAQVNAGQAVSMLQVADGAMTRIHDILLRMKTLSVQAGSGQLSGTERVMLNTEYQRLVSEVDRISIDTEFNGTQLVNGSYVVDQTTGATDFEPADGVTSLTLRGAHANVTQGTISYDTTAASFTVTTGDGTTSVDYTGAIDSTINGVGALTSGTVVVLRNPNSTDRIDLTLSTSFNPDASHAAGTLGVAATANNSFTYKVGTGTSATADEIAVTLNGTGATALGLTGTNVTNQADADVASVAISNAVDTLNNARADIGASQNRLEFAAANIATTLENMEAARSNLLDLDVAAEMSRLTSKQILVQAGVAMLAQANQTPQNLLRLFQN